MQGVLICDTICHLLTGQQTLSLFLCSDVLNHIDSREIWILSYHIRIENLLTNIDRENNLIAAKLEKW